MYLLVFATLVISIIGLFAQILVAQTARIDARQIVIASEMLDWQKAAVSAAASLIDTNTNNSLPGGPLLNPSYTSIVPAGGCSLSAIPYQPAMKLCPGPIDPNKGGLGTPGPVNSGTTAGSGTITNTAHAPETICVLVHANPMLHTPDHCMGSSGPNYDNNSEKVHLSPNFNLQTYMFYSILFKAATGQNYVVTFVPPAASSATNPSGYLSLPDFTAAGSHQISITMSDLSQQFQHTGIPTYNYGTVTGNKLITSLFSYNLPPGTVPDGAMALIGSPDGF